MIYAALLVVSGMIGCALLLSKRLGSALEALQATDNGKVTGDLGERLREVEWLVDQLPQKWEEMVKQSKRSEERARATVRRAQEELSAAGYEHAGVEAEATELRLVHGGGGDEGELPAVPPQVESAGEVDGPEEWEQLTRQRKYGR